MKRVLLSCLFVVACGGSKPAPMSPQPEAAPEPTPEPTTVEPGGAAQDEAPMPDAEEAAAPVPAATAPSAPSAPPAPKTRGPVRKDSRTGDPCDGGE